jgi:hypothetical protein
MNATKKVIGLRFVTPFSTDWIPLAVGREEEQPVRLVTVRDRDGRYHAQRGAVIRAFSTYDPRTRDEDDSVLLG